MRSKERKSPEPIDTTCSRLRADSQIRRGVFSLLWIDPSAAPLRYQKTPETIDTTFSGVHGADSQIRTGDLILTKDALYRLSYISVLSFDNGDILPHSVAKIKRKITIFACQFLL